MVPLDPDIHSPARLTLMTVLSAATEIEFVVLREHLDVSDSVLSKHVSALTTAGYVRSRKGVHQGRRTTWIAITPAGRKALSSHVGALRELIAGVE